MTLAELQAAIRAAVDTLESNKPETQLSLGSDESNYQKTEDNPVPQCAKLHIAYSSIKRNMRCAFFSELVSRDIHTTKELTLAEARVLYNYRAVAIRIYNERPPNE